jgi:hypothetical protein
MTQLNKMVKERRPKANKACQSKANKFGRGQTQLQRSKGRGLRQSCASGEVLAGVGEGINGRWQAPSFFLSLQILSCEMRLCLPIGAHAD